MPVNDNKFELKINVKAFNALITGEILERELDCRTFIKEPCFLQFKKIEKRIRDPIRDRSRKIKLGT